MPFGDGTGPAGAGPMTGRGAGFCAGYAAPGYMNGTPGYGSGFGFARGGRGRRNRFYATGLTGWQRAAWGNPLIGTYPVYGAAPYQPTPDQEMEVLKKQSEYLEKTLTELNQRIQALESEKKNK